MGEMMALPRLLAAAISVALAAGADDNQPDIVSTCLEALLNGYEFTLAPPDLPVGVQLSMYVTQLTEFSKMDESFRANIYFRQQWNDSRLAWDPAATPGCPEMYRDVGWARLWLPDSFFVSAVEFEQLDDSESYIRLHHSGEVTWSRRIVVRFVCAMDFMYYPFDTQRCASRVESYAYSTAEVVFKDGNFGVLPGATDSMGEYELVFHTSEGGLAGFETCIAGTCFPAAEVTWTFPSSGSIGLLLELHVVVAVSFLGCVFVDMRSTDARIALTIFMILTLMTSLAAMRDTLPKEPSYSAMDLVYLITMAAVLMNAVEFCAVNILLVAIDRRKEAITELRDRRGVERERGVTRQPSARLPTEIDSMLAKAELRQLFSTFDPHHCGRIAVCDFLTLIHSAAEDRGRSIGHTALLRELASYGVRTSAAAETVTMSQANYILLTPTSKIALRVGMLYECRAAATLWPPVIPVKYNTAVTEWHLGEVEGWYRCWAPAFYTAINIVWFIVVRIHGETWLAAAIGVPLFLLVCFLAKRDWTRRFASAFAEDREICLRDVNDDGLGDDDDDDDGRGSTVIKEDTLSLTARVKPLRKHGSAALSSQPSIQARRFDSATLMHTTRNHPLTPSQFDTSPALSPSTSLRKQAGRAKEIPLVAGRDAHSPLLSPPTSF